jgi:ABC-type branched-subunit amino acid transport system substrate-binding protein
MIAEGDVFGTNYDRQLNELAPQNGIQYFGPLYVAPGADQKTTVQQMLQRGAEAVILSNNPATAAKTFTAITQLKATAKLKTLGFSGLGTYAFPQQVGDAANGLTFVSTTQTYLSDVPEARWLPGYRSFVDTVITRYGRSANGVEIKGTPAAADCVFGWARAVQAANDFDGARVTRAWEALDLSAQQTRLAVREKFSPSDHEAVPPDGVCVYQWVKNGDRWFLRQLVGPAL